MEGGGGVGGMCGEGRGAEVGGGVGGGGSECYILKVLETLHLVLPEVDALVPHYTSTHSQLGS